MRDVDAEAILQNLLDMKARMILDGDATGYVNQLSFPFVKISEDAELRFESPDTFVEFFHQVSQALRGAAVTDYVRIVTSARFLSADVICGEWDTHIMRRCHRLVDPYRARARLVRVDGDWKFSRCTYAMKCQVMPARLPEASEMLDLPAPQPEDIAI